MTGRELANFILAREFQLDVRAANVDYQNFHTSPPTGAGCYAKADSTEPAMPLSNSRPDRRHFPVAGRLYFRHDSTRRHQVPAAGLKASPFRRGRIMSEPGTSA